MRESSVLLSPKSSVDGISFADLVLQRKEALKSLHEREIIESDDIKRQEENYNAKRRMIAQLKIEKNQLNASVDREDKKLFTKITEGASKKDQHY